MKKEKAETKKDKINTEHTCSCDETCDCGCMEGEECTCEHESESSCGGSCSECGGCGIDSETLTQVLVAKNRELEEKYIRLQAEYLNFKTRTQNEISRMLKYEGEDFIKQILVIKDNLERAIILDTSDIGDEVNKFLSGIKMILGNLTSVLDSHEIKEVDCLGKEFDPHFADAVITEQNANKPENVVLEVLTKGYMYKDKLIRPAMVKVNK